MVLHVLTADWRQWQPSHGLLRRKAASSDLSYMYYYPSIAVYYKSASPSILQPDCHIWRNPNVHCMATVANGNSRELGMERKPAHLQDLY